MMPELGMDMFDTDMAAAPGMPNNAPEEGLPAPEEMMVEPVQTAGAEPLHDPAAAPAMPSDQGLCMYCHWLDLRP